MSSKTEVMADISPVQSSSSEKSKDNEEINNSCQPQHSLEDLHEKIQNFGDINDLETSLTLAAEAGNVLLAENSKLRQDIHDLTLRNSQLANHISNNKHLSDLKNQARIEELEAQNEALVSRIALLTGNLNEIENQLLKEKTLRAELEETFIEHDKGKETTICNQEEEIKQLKSVINKLNRNQHNSTSSKEKLVGINAETQTDTQSNNNNLQLLTEITKFRHRLESVEATVEILQSNLQTNVTTLTKVTNNQFPDKTQCLSSPNEQVNHKASNWTRHTKLDRRSRTVYSASLQVAKAASSAAHKCLTTISSNTPQTQHKKSSMNISNGPPMNAKVKNEDETFNDFFNRNINFYVENMRNQNTNNKGVINKTPNTDTKTATEHTDLTTQVRHQTANESNFLDNVKKSLMRP